MEVYLDNAATTRVLDSVSHQIQEVMCGDYGNPSSKHRKGFEAERYIRTAKKIISENLKCKEKEIIFTSGGTESNNLALIGRALASERKGRHIITTSFEHPSVHEPLFFLKKKGYEITCLPVDSQGHISCDDLRRAMRQHTVLVSIMYVNNEVGSVLNIKEIAAVIHEVNPDTIFHVDAIQAYGKYRIVPSREGIDMMSVSGHKIHAPKGTGFLYVRDGVRLSPIIFGGGQQKGMRSGTENVPGIAGLAVAISEIYQNHAKTVEHFYECKEYFCEQIKENIPDVVVNCYQPETCRETAPHIVSISFAGIKSEVLLHALEEKGIYVSSGSACASNHPGISGTLQAVGVRPELLDSTIRFSFSRDTTMEQLEYTVEQLSQLVPVLRRYRRL